MPVLNIDQGRQQLHPIGEYLVVNNDDTNPIYIAQSSGALNAQCEQLPAQASVVLSGPWYASTLSKAITVSTLVFPGASGWSNPVGVQIALSTLGLATAANQQTQLTVGVPPGVPNIASASSLQQSVNSSPITFYTFTGAGRIWDVSLTAALATGSTYASGRQAAYVQVLAGAVVLEVLELAITDPDQLDSDHGDLSMNGLEVANGTQLILDINGGTGLGTDSQLRASVNVLYSIP